MEEYVFEARELLWQSDRLPMSPSRMAMIEQAVQIADAHGDIDLGIEARRALMYVARNLIRGDILTVATDRKWLSFMRSYPNFIPLSAREVEHIGKALAPLKFDIIYGHYFDRVIAKDAKQVLEKSVARYVAAINGTRGY